MITESEKLLCVCLCAIHTLFYNSKKDYEYNNKYHYIFLFDFMKIYYLCCKINKQAFSWFSGKEKSLFLIIISLNFVILNYF